MADFRIEELEERIAPTAVVIATGHEYRIEEPDGDHISIILIGGAVDSTATVTDATDGNFANKGTIGSITLAGADRTTQLIVVDDGVNDDGGNAAFTIGSISAPGQSIGFIGLGRDTYGTGQGVAVLAQDFLLDVGGSLDTFVMNGAFVADLGHHIAVGGDIGYVNITFGIRLGSHVEVPIEAGTSGAGNIGFVECGGVYGPGNMPIPSVDLMSGPAKIFDDAGTGSSGWVTLGLAAGSGATYAYATVLPVAGGGHVITSIWTDAHSGTLSIASGGTGADIGQIYMQGGGDQSVIVTGKGPVDVLGVTATDNLKLFSNKTVGGDLIYAHADGAITAIMLGKLGNLGEAFGGTGNAAPKFTFTGVDVGSGYAIEAGGAIGRIAAGGIAHTSVHAETIFSITALRIQDTNIYSTGHIGTVSAGAIATAAITSTTGGLDAVKVGTGGMNGASIMSFGGITSVVSKGAVVNSVISATYSAPGDSPSGGAVGTVTAPSMVNSYVSAYTGVGSLTVKGLMATSGILCRFYDPNAHTYVGGSIGTVSAGTIEYGSSVYAHGDITAIKVGAGGFGAESSIKSDAGIGSVSIKGNFSGGLIQANAALGNVTIGGHAVMASMHAAGGVGNVTVKGAIVESDISTNVDQLSNPQGVAIGNVSAAEMLGLNVSTDGGIGNITSKGMISESDFTAATRDGLQDDNPVGGGNIGVVKATGLVGANFRAFGNISAMKIGTDGMSSDSHIKTWDGDFAGMKSAGFIYGAIDVAGRLMGSILTPGTDAWNYGGGYFFTDNSALLTGGRLTVGGSLSAGVKVS